MTCSALKAAGSIATNEQRALSRVAHEASRSDADIHHCPLEGLILIEVAALQSLFDTTFVDTEQNLQQRTPEHGGNGFGDLIKRGTQL